MSIYTIISNFVDDSRSRGSVKNYALKTGSTTITVVTVNNLHGLQNNNYIKISDAEFLISNVNETNKTFEITGTLAGSNLTFKKLSPFFHMGTREEIAVKFDEYSKSDILKFKLFPCVWLVLPVQSRQGINENVDSEYTIELIIADRAQPDKRSQWQIDNNIIPVLQPIYTALLYAIKANIRKEIQYFQTDELSHNKIEGFLSRDENVLNRFANVIEITDLRLKLKKEISSCN